MSTTNSPVRKPLAVKYPFVTESGQDYSDIDAPLNDLCAQSGGYYLLGANNYWHGGIHITDEKFAQHKDKYPVRCMMDGEVIAYRLNQQYPTQSWQANPQLPAKTIRYSNGFCLVRHKYTSQSNQEEGAQNGKMNQLTFYSLYMHLADYKTYTADAAPEPKRVTITKDARARDPGRLSHSLGVLKHGSQILVDPAQTPQPFGSNQYYQVTIKTPADGSGATLTAEIQVCLYAGCFPDGTFPATEKPKLPVYWKGTVTAHSKEPMKVYDTKENCIQRMVEPIARLNEQQTFTFQSDKMIRNVMVKGVSHAIAECQYPTSATFGYEPCSSGWMIVDESQVAWEKVEPTEFDSIVKFSEPLPISAGDPIGLMGVWESPKAPYTNNDSQSKTLMHVELFAADDKAALAVFLGNNASLTTGKKYLKVPKGSKLYSSDGDGGFVHPHELLSAARDYVFEESACAQVKDTAGTVFYNIKGIRNGEGATGPIDFAHVKIEGEVKLVTQHDWKELGFTTIEETNDNSDGYVDPDKIASPLFQDIFKKIDSSHDGVISSDEIQNALQRDKELRNDLCKMIAGHPSEWHRTTQTNMKTKFDELNAQNTDENYKKANQLELDKFLKCEFVSQIDGLTQKLWHFHPVVLPGILSNDDEMDLKWLKVPKGQLTFDAEGNDIENSIYFSRHPHVPNNHGVVIGLSGVTLGRGLDFGQQSREYIESLFSEMEKHTRPFSNSFKNWLLGAVGKQKNTALSYCRDINDHVPIGEQFITRKQQHFLFGVVYQHLFDVTERTLSKGENIDGENISVVISDYEQKVQDVLVDLTFRGDNRKSTRKYFLKDLQNGRNNFKGNISNSCWKDSFAVPEQRFNVRKEYI